MAPQLSSSQLIDRGRLRSLVDLRLREARVLFRGEMFVGSIYLAGYAVECELKHAICSTLAWEHLRRTFQTHDLELLLLHSGLDARLRGNQAVLESYTTISELWRMEGDSSIRYCREAAIDRETATLFLNCVEDTRVGVVPWLRRTTS